MSQYLFFDCSWTAIHHSTEKTENAIYTRELAKTVSHNITIHVSTGKVRMSSNSYIVSLPEILPTPTI